MKRIYYCIVSCCFITMCILTVKKSISSQHANTILLTSKLATLASDITGIENGESNTGTTCTTSMEHDIIEQTCGHAILPVRITYQFKCSNGSYGNCQEGYSHIYYDCNLMIIHKDENLTNKLCF